VPVCDQIGFEPAALAHHVASRVRFPDLGGPEAVKAALALDQRAVIGPDDWVVLVKCEGRRMVRL